MSTTTADVDAYATQVRAALADLAPADRDDLLADLDAHLSEVAAESDESLEARLGPPAAYATELRAAAGLPPVAGHAPGPDGSSPLRRAAAGGLGFLPELLPAWWVARGLLLAWAVARPVAGNAGVLLLALLLVPASVLLGRRTQADRGLRWAGYTASAATLVLVVLVAGITADLVHGTSSSYDPSDQVAPQPDLSQVTNLYPYDKEGRPLRDVQLYDQAGHPVQLEATTDAGGRQIDSVPRRTADGRVVTNVYPREQNAEDPYDPASSPSAVPPPVVPAPKLSGG